MTLTKLNLREDPVWDLEQFFELSLDLLTVAGLDGYFKRLNPTWMRTFGWSWEELRAHPVVDFVHPEDRAGVLAARARLREGIPLRGLINRYRCKDGSYRWLDWRSVAYQESGLVYAVARDITEQRQAERERHRIQNQLILVERMASIGRLAAGVAHEINNPLAYVGANLRTARADLRTLSVDQDAVLLDVDEMLEEAVEGTERIRKIVLGLGTFARMGEECRVSLSVRAVMEKSIDLIGHQLRRRARLIEHYSETPLIEADEARLGEVFRNLLFNAADAIVEGDVSTNEIHITVSTTSTEQVLIEIRDTGEGIAPEALCRIFDPFYTTKSVGQGTGLGLSLCHSIIADMGGEITAESELGRGSIFRVLLPTGG